VPEENLLGEEGDGFRIAMASLDGGRIGIASQSVGVAQAALDAAVSYAKERTQFGKPLFSFQGLQWMMADMATQVEAARQLTYKAAAIFEKLPKNLDRLSKDIIRYSAMAKLFAAETAMKVTTDAVQLLGGYGYVKEYPVREYLKIRRNVMVPIMAKTNPHKSPEGTTAKLRFRGSGGKIWGKFLKVGVHTI